MKTLALATLLLLSACGSAPDASEAPAPSEATVPAAEAPQSRLNPFVGTFKSACQYGAVVEVVNSDAASKVIILRYRDDDCASLDTVDTHERAYSLASGQKLGGIYEVDLVEEDGNSHYAAWRYLEGRGMVMEASYWLGQNATGRTPQSREYSLYDVVLVKQ
jgi:hypothetical protein